MAFPKCFKGAAKRKSTTIIPMIFLFIIAIIIMVLSVQQSYPVVDGADSVNGSDSDTSDGRSVEDVWEEEVCGNVLMGFLSPFDFDMNVKIECDGSSFFCTPSDVTFHLGCPWRERNTIFRLLVDSLVIVSTIIIFTILITEKAKDIWSIIYWIHWVLMLLMFVIFILDCDGLYSGYNSCLNEFNLDGTSLIGTEDTSTSFGGTSFSTTTTFDCKLDPFIYTCLADLAAVIFGFCVWRISMFYKFDAELDISSYNNKEGTTNQPARSASVNTNNEMVILSPNSTTNTNTNTAGLSNTASASGGNIVSPPTGSRTMTATPNPPTTTTTTTKKEDSPDPFEEFNTFGTANQQGTGATDGDNATAEDYVNPFDD